jgi:hypothetical protein
MLYEEALALANILTPNQRAMLFDLQSWSETTETPYNIKELLWKSLIQLAPEGGFVRTERGELVVQTTLLRSWPDDDLLAAALANDHEPAFAMGIAREIEDRKLNA